MSGTRWFGWVRQHGRWLRLVEGDTIDEAARKLTEATARMRPRPPNRDECLTQGAQPDLDRGRATR
jgi:hypothetical protein